LSLPHLVQRLYFGNRHFCAHILNMNSKEEFKEYRTKDLTCKKEKNLEKDLKFNQYSEIVSFLSHCHHVLSESNAEPK